MILLGKVSPAKESESKNSVITIINVCVDSPSFIRRE